METIEMNEIREKRPTFLTVLCILTIVNVGLALIGEISFTASGPWDQADFKAHEIEYAKQKAELSKQKEMPEFVTEIMESAYQLEIDMHNNFYLVVVVSFAMYLIGLFGAIFMLQGKKLGFHLYIIYSLVSVASIYTYSQPQNVHVSIIVMGLLFSGIFIFMYSRNLKWLK